MTIDEDGARIGPAWRGLMRLVVFGLSITSSGATATQRSGRPHPGSRAARLQRDLFERDEPYYAANRDLQAIPGAENVIYEQWSDVRARAAAAIRQADAAIVTSYCHDGIAAQS